MISNNSLWLPYAQMQLAPAPLEVVGAKGCRLQLADGRELVDGIASWWSMAHGYNHPHIVQAIQAQAAQLSHVMFGGLVHAQAMRLSERLCRMTGLERAFFSDSGSTAVEVAMKMALQYWANKGKLAKHKVLCFQDGYHGDTFGAMSVSDPEHSMHKAFAPLVAKQLVQPIPHTQEEKQKFAAFVAKHAGEMAAIIIEPLVQGAGGLKFHDAATLKFIYDTAKVHEVLFIADEIATGFYRTGNVFACKEAQITADILCLGKALTGGHIGLGATLASEQIFTAFLSDDREKALMHGPTFMANPIACAAANASLDIFEREDYAQKVTHIAAQLARELAPCRALKGVVDMRVKGAIGVVQIDPKQVDIYALRTRFVERGVWIRPFGDVVYVMPPLVISDAELQQLTRAIITLLG